MRKGSNKSLRINHEVQKELSHIILNEIKDPRIHPMTSVISAEVTTDLKYCTVHVSVLADKEAQEETIKGLKSASPYIRRMLASTVNLRNTPELKFVLDQGIENGIYMSELIGWVTKHDEEVRALRHDEDDLEEDENVF